MGNNSGLVGRFKNNEPNKTTKKKNSQAKNIKQFNLFSCNFIDKYK